MPEFNIDQAFQTAFRHYHAGQLQQAQTLCGQILARQPRHAKVLNLLGLIAMKSRRFDTAFDLFGRAVALDPTFAEAHGNLGNALREAGQPAQAVIACRAAIGLTPELVDAHVCLGLILQKQGQLEEAVAAYREAIRLNPNLPGVYNNLGTIFWLCGGLDETIDCYRRAISLQPGFAPALKNLADVLVNTARFDEAERVYERLAPLLPAAAPSSSAIAGTAACEMFVIGSIRNGPVDLLPHWLDHYSRLGADRILLGVFDDVSIDGRGQIEHCALRWKFETFRQRWINTTEQEQQEQQRDACRAFGGKDDTWIVYADLDEFHEFPAPPRQIIAAAEERGVQAIYGWLLDRVAADGSFPPIPPFEDSASPSLWDAFPVGCHLSGKLLRASAHKVMMARLSVPIMIGHHDARNCVPYPIPLGRLEQYIVHHFKWHRDAVARLKWGLTQANCNSAWQRESRRFLEWINSNGGRINPKDPAILATP